MTTERFGVIRLTAQQLQHPELLTGLDLWLQSGLLSSSQVRQFCQTYLICALPEPVAPKRQLSSVPAAQPLKTVAATDFSDAVPAAERTPSRLARTLQSLMAEIGVIWLLGLGVFMVVVSSGVLAASQWHNFSPVGQYGILLSYTLAFWGVSSWTGRQPTLQLTTRMLQTTTLLIIPVNFWMMDSLHLWQSGIGIGINLIAALVLAGVTYLLLSRLAVAQSGWIIGNSLALSGLHWGWSLAGVPLIAAYVGTIGTAVLTYVRVRRQPPASGPLPNLAITTLILAFATLLLLGRAILVAQVPAHQLGLALGICGWLFCWLTQRTDAVPNLATRVWNRTGIALLGLGWMITVPTNPPVQAFSISSLGLWLLGNRLRHQGNPATVIALLLIGLQTYALLWRLLPFGVQQNLLTAATDLFGAEGMPGALLGLAGFPYLWLMLSLARWLRRRQPDLANLVDGISLGLGTLLIGVSVFNPTVRALSLTLAAGTLIAAIRRRSLALAWLYLSHSLILIATYAWIDANFPQLSPLAWVRVLLVGTVVEWGLSLGEHRAWRRSCWHFGLVLAGLSYALLPNWSSGFPLTLQNLIWLIVPVCLAGLAQLRQFPQPRLAAWLSAGSLLAQLLLLNTVSGWMIGLAVATGLMLLNTLILRQVAATVLTVGFALELEALALYHFWSDVLTFDWVLLLLAGNLWLLWLAQTAFSRRESMLLQHYAAAAHFWAIVICLLSLLQLSLYNFVVYAFSETWFNHWTVSAQLVLSSGLITCAMVYYLWQHRASNWAFYGLAWATELWVATFLGWQQQTVDSLAIVTLGLGLAVQLGADVWVHRSGQSYLSSWHGIPLLYAGFGLLLGHHQFSSTTGLYTLAAALIGVGVGRRMARFQSLTVAALLLGSIGTYELLIYQLMQSTQGNGGDGISLMAGLAALIAIATRLGQRWLLSYLRLTSKTLAGIAHLHWGIGSGLALLAPLLSLSSTGFWLWLLCAASLTGYALANGRRSVSLSTAPLSPAADPPTATPSARTDHPADLWTYVGLLEAWGTVSYALHHTLPPGWLEAWAGTLAATVAVGLYFLPWQRWGWRQRPWCNMAIVLPGIVVLFTFLTTTLQGLLIVAAFYAWLAKAERRPRLSYLSIFLFDWATLRFLDSAGWLTLSWISALVTGSLLYMVQVDPALQADSAREQRHWLRLLALALLSLTLLYQAEVEAEATALIIRVVTLLLTLAAIFWGLMLRVRAFLYIGTITFILQIMRLLWLFIYRYSLLLWAIGIVLGLTFIWIAATFEARRSQVNALMQYWLTEFDNWE